MTNEYNPDIVSPPGETLGEILNDRNISINEFSELSGISVNKINGIINGSERINKDISEKLGSSLNIPPHFWDIREYHYRNSDR